MARRKILRSVIKSAFDVFQIHREMVFGDTPIVRQNMFGRTPESFNPIKVNLPASTAHKDFCLIV